MRSIYFFVLFLMYSVLIGGCSSNSVSDSTPAGANQPVVSNTGSSESLSQAATVTLFTNATSIDTLGSSTITATVKDSSGFNVPDGTTVTFEITTNPNLGAVTTSTTTTSGVATATFTAASSVGTAVVTATSGTITATISITISVGTITTSANTTSIDTLGTSIITASVKDSSGFNVPDGTVVTFVITTNPILGAVTASATTTSGVATATFTAASSVGTAVVTATSGTIATTISITISVGTMSTSANTTSIDTLGSSTITATVKDSSGFNVPDGTIVTFAVTTNPTLGSVTASTTTISGVATATFTAASSVGTAEITARSGTISAAISITISVGTITISSNATSIDTLGTSTITASVKDSSGFNVTDGTIVTFSITTNPTLGSVTASAATISGVATAIFTAASSAGTAVITATSGTITAIISITISIGTMTTSANVTSIDALGTSIITASVKDSSGFNVPDGTVVTFAITTNPTLGAVTASATTTSGDATATFTAASSAGTAVVTATSGTITSTISITVSVGTITAIVNPSSGLTVLGTATISATLLNSAGVNVADGTAATFTISANPDLGSITPTATTVSGIATATFTAGTAPGLVDVTVTSGGGTVTVTIPISSVVVGSIQFKSAVPNVIGVQGSGQQEASIVVFSIKDINGQAVVDGVNVTFTIDGPKGGETLSPATASSANGDVTTTLQAGTVAGPVRITASTVVGNTTISSTSSGVSIGGGAPSATHFDLSASRLRLAGFTHDNLQSTISAFLADRFGNFNVLTGTSISFYTESGAIDRNDVTNSTGIATVTFRTQDPLPVLQAPTISVSTGGLVSEYATVNETSYSCFPIPPATTCDRNPRDGWSTILATVIGEETFIDANGNGIFDSGETFGDLGEPYIDQNDNDRFDLGEFFVDFDNNGTHTLADGVWSKDKMIWTEIKLTMTGTTDFGPNTTRFADTSGTQVLNFTIPNGGSVNLLIYVSDFNQNTLPAGSTVTIEADAGKLSGGGTFGPFGDGGPSTGPSIFGINLADADVENATQEVVSITVTIVTNIASVGTISDVMILTGTLDFGPSISTDTLAPGTVGTPYTALVAATGGTSPFIWSATNLPAGLLLNASTGVITGTPSAAGDFNVLFTVTDSSAPTISSNIPITLTISAPPALSISTPLATTGTVGVSYFGLLEGTGGVGAYTWSATNLPGGLLLGASTGIISGIPSTTGTFNVLFTVTDSLGTIANSVVTIIIS